MSNILAFVSFNIQRNRRTEFCEWLKQHEPAIKDKAPEGWTYPGTYSTKFSTSTNEYLMTWDINKFQNLDDFPKSGEREFQIALGEFTSFLENKPQWTFYEPAANLT